MGVQPHLVCFFVSSAGKNGDELGSDEAQIVQVVYLLFQKNNNKVEEVVQVLARPEADELEGSVLTEECRLYTGLDVEAITAAAPLAQVLGQFDIFLSAKGVHSEQGARPVYLVTDGQDHLRQCLHHECCNKGITLPNYFYKFYDLRKEFRKHYKTDAVLSIRSMLEHLGLEEDGSVEHGVRQCLDMARILSSLVSDGHVFSDPEIVNDRLDGGICSKTEHVSDGLVVRARGLPWQSSDQDVARFFKGLNIAKGGVALCLSPQGRRNGEALIRFESEEHRDLALKRHKHHIGQRYIEVYRATGKDFIDVAGGSNSEAQAFLSRGGQVIVRMRGLPFTCTSQQVLEFFTQEPHSCQVVDGEDGVLFVHYSDGRSTGDAFVLFATEVESEKALKKHREMMGSRYIELFKSTTAEVQQVLNRSMDPRNPEQSGNQMSSFITHFPAGIQLMPQALITSGVQRDCIRLRNLPGATQVTDILTFLGELSQFIVYQGVHMVFTAAGQPSGEAFIQLDSEEAAIKTVLSRHKRPMTFTNKKRLIDVIQCSGNEMSCVLTSAMSHMPVPLSAVLPAPQIPPPSHITLQRQLLTPVTPFMTPTSLTPPEAYPYISLTQPTPPTFTPTPLHVPQPPTYYPPVIYWYQTPPVSPAAVLAPTYYTTATDVAAGQCPGPHVVVMTCLPVGVTVQDIVSFFQDFPEVQPELVNLQMSPEGKPTGNALVFFSSRPEAERAVLESSGRHIGNTPIELFMA